MYVKEGDHQTYLTFASKSPHKTRWLVISFMEDTEPTALIDDLRDAGWARENASLLPLIEFPTLNGRKEIDLSAKGSDIFGYWTVDERKMHMANARKALRKHGITGVPHWKMTLADMM